MAISVSSQSPSQASSPNNNRRSRMRMNSSQTSNGGCCRVRQRTVDVLSRWLPIIIAGITFHNLYNILTTRMDVTDDLMFGGLADMSLSSFVSSSQQGPRDLLFAKPQVWMLELLPVNLPHQYMHRRRLHEPDFGELDIGDNGGNRRWIMDEDDEKIQENRRYDKDAKGRFVPTGYATRNDDPWPVRRPLNCNTFHELGLYEPEMIPYVNEISHGYFREAIKVDLSWLNQTKTLALKRVRAKHHSLDKESIETVRIETVVMEELRSNKYVINIHGFCQLVTFVEYMPLGDMLAATAPGEWRMQTKLYDKHRVDPLNNYTVAEKIRVSLEMSKGIAALHGAGYVHDDLKLEQFLNHPDGHIQLNDFNRAMHQFNDTTQKWETFSNGGRHGDMRSPEEYHGGVLTVKEDIFTMGGIFFSVITGLFPFDEVYTHDRMTNKFIDGELPYIDKRYSENPVLKKLIELIMDCWKYKPEERPTADEMVHRLEIMTEMVKKHPEWDVQLAQKPKDRHSSSKPKKKSEVAKKAKDTIKEKESKEKESARKEGAEKASAGKEENGKREDDDNKETTDEKESEDSAADDDGEQAKDGPADESPPDPQAKEEPEQESPPEPEGKAVNEKLLERLKKMREAKDGQHR